MKKFLIALIILGLFGLNLYLLSRSIYGGDAGDLVTAAFVKGIPHAPGFPLFEIIGRILIKTVPIGTVAWKVALISALGFFFARIFIFLILLRLTKSYWISIAGILVYSFLYPVWLFTEVPEVVSLTILFLTGFFYFAIRYYETKKNNYLYPVLLCFSLGLFHNYIIILALPGIVYLLYRSNVFPIIKKKAIPAILLFLVGALPYGYFLIISRRYPVLDNDHPANLINLVRLMTRVSYGTFRLSSDIFFNWRTALMNILTVLNFINIDFKFIGIIFILLGAYYCFKQKNRVGKAILINTVAIFLFFPYASFPIYLDFQLGTLEKYLPILYFYLLIIFLYGIIESLLLLKNIINNLLLRRIIYWALNLSIILYAIILARNNYGRIFSLKNDNTAENLGRDILYTVPKNGILSTKSDTAYFDTLYVHYVLGIRPDVKIIRTVNLNDPVYRNTILKLYPDIIIPSINGNIENFITSFYRLNSNKYPMVDESPILPSQTTWIPRGILWQYIRNKKELGSINDVIKINLQLWLNYHSPLAGSLFRYQNLLLSDVLRLYAQGHYSFGLLLLKKNEYSLAENEFASAVNYLPVSVDNYAELSQSQISQKKCHEADKTLQAADKINPDNTNILKQYINLYGNCYHDINKAQYYATKYKKIQADLNQ